MELANLILGCDYVSLPVEDMEEAMSSYRRILGLTPIAAASHRAEFCAGSLRLALYPRESEEGRGGEVAFRVPNLMWAMEALRDKGVAFPHGRESFEVAGEQGRLARFQDPSGNRLELIERG